MIMPSASESATPFFRGRGGRAAAGHYGAWAEGAALCRSLIRESTVYSHFFKAAAFHGRRPGIFVEKSIG
jgi:hypothetical protein